MPQSTRKRRSSGPTGTLTLTYSDGPAEVREGPLWALRDLLAGILADPDIVADLAAYELRSGGQLLQSSAHAAPLALSPLAAALRGVSGS